ncbi:peptidoglycan DD-metalloendopeptidase family protein [Celeribacter sp. PS-C1]|uniref:peptidoglycan DD-metalloendopeptidase family protein n=1 Tax=Celeribacter sp. PS-C1 TaxID=2820813 RepID=UPI001CA500D7|nr:peptidoglycan DD-metalloendopeptidase family protein [Celeribacter sp. PS-C1]MBW6418652.1 peptidoglycan DD-metalloendopeptidase family protein [Celeribacter sp. PS-C1]
MNVFSNTLATALSDAVDLHQTLLAELAQAHLSEAEANALLSLIRERADAPLATRLSQLDAGFLTAVIRHGAGFNPIPGAASVQAYLRDTDMAPVISPDPKTTRFTALPSDRPGMPAFSDRKFDPWFENLREGDEMLYGYGLYGEKRSVYLADQYRDASGPEPRARHLGIDIFAPAGLPITAPLAGRVHRVAYNADPLDYGHTVIVEHVTEDGLSFWTLNGHLGQPIVSEGQEVAAGQTLAPLGDWHENGGWAPHLHFQLITSLLSQTGGNFFGVGHDSLWPVWAEISPDPNLILRLPEAAFTL